MADVYRQQTRQPIGAAHFWFTRQIHLVRLKSFEAKKAFPPKSAFHESKKFLIAQVAAVNSGTPPVVVSMVRSSFGSAGHCWRT